MDLVRYAHGDEILFGVLEDKIYPINGLNGDTALTPKLISELKDAEIGEEGIAINSVHFLPFSKAPSQIIGIGLNYLEHATDLDEKRPEKYPVLFLKTSNTLIGSSDDIILPKMSERTTGEAELGIIIGKDCRNVLEEDWMDYVAGFVPIIDMTAEDILKKNTRYLGLSKIFDTFLSQGGHLKTTLHQMDDLKVRTVLNGELIGENKIGNMKFQPSFLVSFISQLIPLKAGDLIITGTPKATPLRDGDVISCHIDGFIPLENSVRAESKP